MNCQYCYENKWREEAHPKVEYDMDAILAVIDKYPEDRQITLHGGEPLILPKQDVERILSAIYKKTGKSGIQTNGMMIDDEYMSMFEKYKTSVGLSLDGTGELNRYRADEKTTSRLFSNLLEMHNRKINLSVIAIISKANAETDELLDKFEQFIATLSGLKITGRINPCFPSYGCALSDGRLIEVYKRLAWFVMSHGWKWSPFTDMWNSLRGDIHVVCIFKECDIFHTASCEVVLDDGSISNCMRVSSRGLYLRHPAEHKTRGEILSQVEQVDGGCKGCEFWENCTGGCPSQAIDNDWRNRTVLCSMYKEVFHLLYNIQSFGVASQESKKQPCGAGGHSDGFEHQDGDTRHLDSDRAPAGGHSDGVEHLDGSMRHLDSNIGRRAKWKSRISPGLSGRRVRKMLISN